MPFSHSSAASPSPLFAVVAVALIHRVRPDWLAIGVTDAAKAEALNPERISRLASRVMGLWQSILDTHSRRGRPVHQPDKDDELGQLRALLAVATTLLCQVNFRRRALRALVVGAWLRLRTELPQLTQARFCETLALPTRTLQSWLANNPPEPQPLVEPKPAPLTKGCPKRSAKPRKPRRPRFGFDLVIADTQVGADTTDLSVLGVPLQLVAAQDIGGRDQNLFDSVVVDDHESSAYRASKARRDRLEQQCNDSDATAAQHAALRHSRLADPVAWLREAIVGLVSQWQPRQQQLLFDGQGAALGWMHAALRRILVVHGDVALLDIANGVMDECARAYFGRLGQPGVDAIRTLPQREISTIITSTPNSSCLPASPLATLWNTGRTKRPPAPNHLPI